MRRRACRALSWARVSESVRENQNRAGDDADKPSILRKHALEARYDVSQLGVVPKKQIVEDMERRRKGEEPAPMPAPAPARRRRGGRRHRRDEPESKDES